MIVTTDISLAYSPSCGMCYRRIIDVTEPSQSPALMGRGHYSDNVMLRASNVKKRKLPDSFEDTDQGFRQQGEEFESDLEDDIHLFRRVHIRSRTAKRRPQWDPAYMNPCLLLSDDGLTVSLPSYEFWPNNTKAFATRADQQFDHNFFYFEVTVLSKRSHAW